MAARHDSARLGLPRPEPPERTCGEQPIDQPVENVLKIDRAFISRIDTDADNRAIVRTIVALAHNFGLKVVAEGVETPEEVDELLAIDCEYAQGYFFSRPVDEDTAMHLLSAGHCGKEPFPRRA